MDMPLPSFIESQTVSTFGSPTFINVPWAGDVTKLDAHVAILGIPYGVPYRMDQSWTHEAPKYIREKSMRFRQALMGHFNFDFDGEVMDGQDIRVVDCGDVPGDPFDIPGTVARATETVRTILSRGAVPIIFGGDDSIPVPVLRAYKDYGPIVLIQIDEHLDFADHVNGIRDGYSSPMRRASEMGWVEKIFQIGLHGMGGVETSTVQAALAAGNVLITEREVHKKGISWVLKQIPDNARYFITLDFDGLDPSISPAVSHPEPGGLNYHEASELFRGLAEKGRIVGMDMVEFVPEHDLHGLGARTAGRLVLHLINAMTRSGQLSSQIV